MRTSRTRIAVFALTLAVGCKPSDILSVPPPAGLESGAALASQAGAEGALDGAKWKLFVGIAAPQNQMLESGLLADEYVFAEFGNFLAGYATVDARITANADGFEVTDQMWEALLLGRTDLLVALPYLQKYEPPSGSSKIGEAYALIGYSELLLAESFCGGTPLSQVLSGGGLQYGMPLTTDSILGTAIAHFNAAVAAANGDPPVSGLAAVGLGRALLDRGQYADADTAVATVPTSYVYNVTLLPNGNSAPFTTNYYADQSFTARGFNIADREGSNGINFVSAADPRLQLDSSQQTSDGADGFAVPGNFYFPLKFENDLADIPLSTGIEARLIQAEAALQRGDAPTWATDLNALRADSADTHMPFPDSVVALPADSTTGASHDGQVDLMFRERAFWMFGTGTRLGDLRRLIRQYGRDQGAVFPVGPYPNGTSPGMPFPLPNYGADVNMTLPTQASLAAGFSTISNPNYKGCLTPTTSA
jgi:hypothetical protein